MKSNWLSLGLSLALIAGCATSGMEMIVQPNAANDQKHLVVHNESLANKITITSVQTRMVGGQLEANLALRNLTSRDKLIQYRFSWFDKDNFEIEPGREAWTPVAMHGAAEVNVNGLAPNPSAQTFKLNVREQ